MNSVRQWAMIAGKQSLRLNRPKYMMGSAVGARYEGKPNSLTGTVPLINNVRNLPVCSVVTNLNDDLVPKNFHIGLSKVIAETLNKPEKSIAVSVSTNARICRSGSADPSVVIEIWSIGVFDAERNKKYTKDLFGYVLKELKGIPEDRIVILFHPLQKEDAGHLIYQSLK